MKGWSSAIFPLSVMLVLAGLTFWLMRAIDLPQERRDGKNRHDPDTIITDMTLRRLDPNGRLQYELRAPRLTHYPDDETTHVERPNFRYLHPQKPTVTMTAERARVTQNGDEVRLEENVRVERAGGPRREALVATMPDLTIITDAELAYTASPVEITQGRSWLRGTGLSINNKTQTYVLEQKAVGQFASKHTRTAKP